MIDDKYRQIFSKNLRYYMDINSKTQNDIVRDLKINKSAISTWCNGTRLPRMDKVEALARYFGVNKSDLIEEKVTQIISTKKYLRSDGWIPVLGRVAAGIPIEQIEEILDYEQIDPRLLDSAEYFALKIKGHSMEPRIKEDDIIIVRCQPDVESGEIAVVQVNGNEATCKRVKKYDDSIALISLNQAYEPMVFTTKEVNELPVTIIGKVIELRGKL